MPRVHPQQEWSVERVGWGWWQGFRWDTLSNTRFAVTRRYWLKSSAQDALEDYQSEVRQ